MPKVVRWVATLDGVPLAFPSASRVVTGETCALDEAEAERAIEAGLAVAVESERAVARKGKA